ncbi:MAG: hypothetical protein LUF35_09960, partial [Lachnospiraceae bacterium]|nr:hypothetical protein [Lachnospiraceae bacterium]
HKQVFPLLLFLQKFYANLLFCENFDGFCLMATCRLRVGYRQNLTDSHDIPNRFSDFMFLIKKRRKPLSLRHFQAF